MLCYLSKILCYIYAHRHHRVVRRLARRVWKDGGHAEEAADEANDGFADPRWNGSASTGGQGRLSRHQLQGEVLRQDAAHRESVPVSGPPGHHLHEFQVFEHARLGCHDVASLAG